MIALTITAATAATAAYAAPEALDCSSLNDIERNKTYEADPAIIQQCIQRGWDPPLKWRPDDGQSIARAPGSGGFSVSGRQPPNLPPGARNGNASVSSNMFNFTLSIPPWRGFPCQLPGGVDLCGGNGNNGGNGGNGGNGNNGGNSSCPISSDTNGTYGQQTLITATGSQSLTCGGAVPLSTYLMGGTTTPTGLIATEAGSRTVWVYRAEGSKYTLTGTAQLPSAVCTPGQNPVPTAIQPPIAQIVAFNSATSNVALRLAMSVNSNVADPFDPDPDAEQPTYFLIPTGTGTPQIPTGCPNINDFYRTISALTTPVTIESSTTPGCEGTAETCGSSPQSPTTPNTCDAMTLNPNSGSCEGTTLFAVLNRPNLIYPPASTASFTAIDGRTALMAGSSGGMRLYTHAETLMYFGALGGTYTLPEGGMLKLNGNLRLVMNGPSTISASGAMVTMANGGTIIDVSGSTVQNFPPGSSYSPQASLPYVVKVNRNVELPAGFVLPTQPSPFVRLPVQVQ